MRRSLLTIAALPFFAVQAMACPWAGGVFTRNWGQTETIAFAFDDQCKSVRVGYAPNLSDPSTFKIRQERGDYVFNLSKDTKMVFRKNGKHAKIFFGSSQASFRPRRTN